MATHKSLLGMAALVAALLAVATLGGVCVDARVVAARELQGSARLEAARAEIKGESDPTETETAASGGDVETAATEEPAAAIEAEPAAAEAEIADTGPKENEDAATATAEVQAELQEAGKTEEQMSESEQEVRFFALRMAASAAKATTKHSNSQHNKQICFSLFSGGARHRGDGRRSYHRWAHHRERTRLSGENGQLSLRTLALIHYHGFHRDR